MTDYQQAWRDARDRLRRAVTALGFPSSLADLMAKQLGSPKAMDRMASYTVQARPETEEQLVDEMLAICAEIEAWRQKKASREATAQYNLLRWVGLDDSDDDME